MNWKNRLTNYNFWISIVSAVLLILQAFNIEFDVNYINEIITAVLGLLVVIGIINDPTKSSSKIDTSSTVSNVSNAGSTNATTKESEKTESTTNEIKDIAEIEKAMPFVNEDETIDVDSSDNMEILVEKVSQQSENSPENISETDTITDNSIHLGIEQIADSEKMSSDDLATQDENKTDANIDETVEIINGVTEPVLEEKQEAVQQDDNRDKSNTFNIVNN